MLELTPVGWQRHPRPVLTGTARNPSALGPKVVYSDGMWRMWFRSTTGEPAKAERPVSEIHYTESVNGIDAWSTPRPFYTQIGRASCRERVEVPGEGGGMRGNRVHNDS